MDVWVALLLIGLAVVAGGLLLRSVPSGLLAFGAILVIFGFGIPALVINDNKSSGGGGGGGSAAASGSGSSGQAAPGGQTTTGGSSKSGGGGGKSAQLDQGKQIFTQSCGTCHTLADAGTNGNVGPVLDQIKPDKQRALNAIKNGGAGSGAMPAGIVSGKEADAVATYVSTVAGK